MSFTSRATEKLTPQDGGWSDGTRTLSEVEPLEDSAPIKGTISSVFFMGMVPNSGVTGGISSSSSTKFLPDGTCNGSSVGGAFGNFGGGGSYATSHENASGGRHAVKNGLLVVTSNDGAQPTAELALRVSDKELMIGTEFISDQKQA